MAVIVPYLVAVSEKVKGSVELKAAAQFVRHDMEGEYRLVQCICLLVYI